MNIYYKYISIMPKSRKMRKVPRSIKKYVKNTVSRALPDKNFNVSTTGISITSANNGTAINYTGVTVGTGDTNRIGDVVVPRRLECRAFCHPNKSSSTVPHRVVRATLVQFKESLAASLSAASLAPIVYRNTSSNLILNSPFNIDGMSRYKVLMDRRFTISPGQTGFVLNKTITASKMNTVRYVNGTTEATGHIYLLISSDDDTAAENPIWSSQFNLRYNDQ